MGLIFLWCASDRVRADGPFAPPAFSLMVLFTAVVSVPLVLYLQWSHPQWSWLYAVSPDRLRGLWVVPVMALASGGGILAWCLGSIPVRRGNRRFLLWALGIGGIALVLSSLLLSGRLGVYGSQESFLAGTAPGLMQVKLGYIMMVLFAGIAAASVFVAVELMRDSRRVRTR